MKIAISQFHFENVIFGMCIICRFDQWWILNKKIFWKKCHFLAKNTFFGKKWLFDPLDSAGQQSCFRTFCLGANLLPFYEKKIGGLWRKKCWTNFSIFTLTFLAINFRHQTVLDNILQSIIVTNKFCIIPHSLIFSFNFSHFGLKQNPTGLQATI